MNEQNHVPSDTPQSPSVERVLLAAPRGFCAGVEMAIKALAWMVRSFEAPVYCYHEIVHNMHVVDRFRDRGVIFVEDVDEVPEGSKPGLPKICPTIWKITQHPNYHGDSEDNLACLGHELLTTIPGVAQQWLGRWQSIRR